MCGLGICYSYYWVANLCEVSFLEHLETLKHHYGTFKFFSTLLEGVGASTPKQTALSSCKRSSSRAWCLRMPMAQWWYLMLKLWRRLSHNSIILDKMSECFKVVDIAHIHVLGRVEDERTFKSLTFLKRKLRNQFTPHLDLVVHMFAHDFYIGKTFPYQLAIFDWKSEKVGYGGRNRDATTSFPSQVVCACRQGW